MARPRNPNALYRLYLRPEELARLDELNTLLAALSAERRKLMNRGHTRRGEHRNAHPPVN